MSIKERIDILVDKQAQAKEFFIKCQGAIEILTEMLQEQQEKESGGKE